MLIAFDPDCYRVGRPDRAVIQINREEDIQLINALQILNAHQCLYFRGEEDEPRFRETTFQVSRADRLFYLHRPFKTATMAALATPILLIHRFCRFKVAFNAVRRPNSLRTSYIPGADQREYHDGGSSHPISGGYGLSDSVIFFSID
jgi:hypothetical protein